MHKLAPLFLAFAIVGCASVTPPRGSFLSDNQQAIEATVAQDAVTQITALYPPAHTRIALQHAATDPFGVALIEGLRNAGYALVEFSDTGKQHTELGEPLSYVLDQLGERNLYRLTVSVGDQSLSRLYLNSDGNTTPAGYWVRKE